MRPFGIPISELGALLAIIVTLFGAFSWIFNMAVVKPLTDQIAALKEAIQGFSSQMEESKKDRTTIHQRINKIDKRVTLLEEHDKWEEKQNG